VPSLQYFPERERTPRQRERRPRQLGARGHQPRPKASNDGEPEADVKNGKISVTSPTAGMLVEDHYQIALALAPRER
jgi:hypothetical protein